MSIPTVRVTFTFNGQDGQPVSGVRILAKLSTLEKFNGLVVPQIYEGETDETGIAYLDVFPNELGSEGSEYKITIVDAQNGFSERLVAVIPNYDCNLWEITDLEPYDKKYAGAEFTEEVLGARDMAIESATVAVSSSESASSSATTATEQANIAITKSTEASEAATIATEKATISIEKANEASASATSAEGSASSASDSATTATDKATVATTKADEASMSATTAMEKADIATAKADEASNSATTATEQATTATTKADEASSSASSASSSANSASNSASGAETYKDKSREWATTAEDVEVETGYYSAFHWAQKAAQSASGDANNISYDNSGSGMSANNVQLAIDESLTLRPVALSKMVSGSLALTNSLNITNGVFTYTDGKTNHLYNVLYEAIASASIDFTGVADGYVYVYKEKDGSYGFLTEEPKFDGTDGGSNYYFNINDGYWYNNSDVALTTPVSFIAKVYVQSETPQRIEDWFIPDTITGDIQINGSAEITEDLTVKGNLSGMSGFDLGQEQADVTALRNSNVLYTNNTGKPMEIAVYTVNDATAGYILLQRDGLTILTARNGTGAKMQLCLTANIPPSSTYKVIAVGVSIERWTELGV